MFKTEAETPEEYIEALPEDRQEAIATVRKVIVDNLPEGYEEVINWGMICYQVPLSRKPDTYNKQPLSYITLASQKNHMAVYLMGVYGNPEVEENFVKKYKESGKKLDMGKSCVRFKKLDDLPLELLAETVASTSVDELIELYDRLRS